MRQDDPIIAWVVSDQDPSEMGRVQIRINGIHDDVEDEHLPWAAPKIVPGYGALEIPPIGHMIYVALQDHGNGDPLYEGKPLAMGRDSAMSVPDVFRYLPLSVPPANRKPLRQGWWDFIGNYMYRNQKDGMIQFAAAAGLTATLNEDGSVVVSITGIGEPRHDKSDPDAKRPKGGNPRITFNIAGTTVLELQPGGMTLITPSGVQTWGT